MNAPAQFDYDGAFRGRRALVTGGAGFIGSHIAQRLIELGAVVRVIDDLTTGRRDNVPSDAEFTHASILDDAALRDGADGCTYVFHEAAMVSVPMSVEQPLDCIDINVMGTERVLRAARDAGAERLVFAASAAAYGNTARMPSRETDPPDCRSPYAASKVAGEALLTAFGHCYDLSTVSLRYFNVFGPRQDPNSPYAAAISAFADALIHGRRPTVFGTGEQTRDFVHVDNVVHANLLAASCETPLHGEVMNIGLGRRTSLLEILEIMGGHLGVEVEPGFEPPRPGDVLHSMADISAARKLIGYEPIVTIEAGLRQTLEWMKLHAA